MFATTETRPSYQAAMYYRFLCKRSPVFIGRKYMGGFIPIADIGASSNIVFNIIKRDATWFEVMHQKLQSIFINAFSLFLEKENDNILMGTSERNLCARLACILETTTHAAGLTDYIADVEYNRKQGGRIKSIINDQMQEIKITTDLILHSRGKIIDPDNLIAFEMKRIDHKDSDLENDRIRLRAMTKSSFDDIWSSDGETHPEYVCGYKIGYLAILDASNRCFHMEEYSGGRHVNSFECSF